MSVNEQMVEQNQTEAGADNTAGTVPATGEKTFTQEDVNRIVQERLAREQERLTRELEKSHVDKVSALERRHSVTRLMDKHDFVNDITKNYIADAVIAALGEDSNKGRTVEDVFKQITHDGDSPKEGIFLQKNPNRLPGPAPVGNIPRSVDAVRRAMGLQT